MKHYREIYRVEQLPVFQNRMYYSEKDAKNCVKGDVILVQDLQTGLIFNQAFRPELMHYDSDYQNEQAVSSVFQKHIDRVVELIEHHFWGRSLIEVGCGKGYFLEQLQKLEFEITGFDPTYEGSNPAIFKQYFSAQTKIQADGIILRHVLEHVQDPIGFLAKIRDANGGGGKIYIEVPCFEWITNNRVWFDIFYEHVNYFRLSDFKRMFDRLDRVGHLFGGQYMYAIADLSTLKTPNYDRADNFEFPDNFLVTVEKFARKLQLPRTKRKNNAIWGGASKGVIFSLFVQRAGGKIDLVIDINRAKQQKYLAATGLQVRSPEEAVKSLEAGADIFVMNRNYLSEIVELTDNQYNYLVVDYESL